LFDLKSEALSYTLSTLGITDPTRFVYTLRNRFIIGASTNYYVIQRNFDPVTFEPSPFINGQLWTYTSILDPATPAGNSIAVTEPVDPLASGGLINAPVTAEIADLMLPAGGFWTGLTRDDVGGLRYLYRHNNINVENAPPNAARAGAGTTSTISSGGSSSSPWGSADQVFFPTNTPTTGTGTGGSTNIINTALRPGVAKLNFVRVDYNSFFGAFGSNRVTYTDRVITNGATIEQSVVRPLLSPDLVFDAQDLQGGDANITFPNFNTPMVLPAAFVNNDANNGLPGTDGPGQIQPSGTATPQVIITFNKVGPATMNTAPAFVNQVTSLRLFRWGSFDGSTNAPIVYPSGSSISDLEQQIGSGGGGGGGGVGGSVVSPWTHADQVYFPPGTTVGGTTPGTGAGTGGAGTGSAP
jgi:hypothetical protein